MQAEIKAKLTYLPGYKTTYNHNLQLAGKNISRNGFTLCEIIRNANFYRH
jgi:hypothetical protein